jgi:hypothetical protein
VPHVALARERQHAALAGVERLAERRVERDAQAGVAAVVDTRGERVARLAHVEHEARRVRHGDLELAARVGRSGDEVEPAISAPDASVSDTRAWTTAPVANAGRNQKHGVILSDSRTVPHTASDGGAIISNSSVDERNHPDRAPPSHRGSQGWLRCRQLQGCAPSPELRPCRARSPEVESAGRPAFHDFAPCAPALHSTAVSIDC